MLLELAWRRMAQDGFGVLKEGREWMGHIPQSNTTEIKKQDRLPVACQEVGQ